MSKAADLANLIGNINAGGGGVNRNLVVNGAMNVAQRGTSLAAVGNNDYTLDKFQFTYSQDGAFTVTQDSSSPDGFANSLKVDVTTADSSLATTQYLVMEHKFEAQNLHLLKFGKSDAKNITLSFYVKSNKTGTYAVNIIQSDNSSKMANLTYTIDSADTWEQKSLTFTGDTAGAIDDNAGVGLKLTFSLALGSQWTSGDTSASFRTYANGNYGADQSVNILDSTSNEWLITGVQLEVGQNATEFEHEPFERTLAKCQRYFQTWTQEFAHFSTNNYGAVGDAVMHADTYAFIQYTHPVQLRTTPALTFNGNFAANIKGADRALSSLQINQATPYITSFYGSVADNNEAGEVGYMRASNDGDASIFFSSEL
tara:strand:+ start:213 stop:1322 length:1110 start_codon:yes stop_codon:yes gene_type:complete